MARTPNPRLAKEAAQRSQLLQMTEDLRAAMKKFGIGTELVDQRINAVARAISKQWETIQLGKIRYAKPRDD